MTVSSRSERAQRWFTPREDIPVVGERWSDWGRWAVFRAGIAARRIRAEAEAVVLEAGDLLRLSDLDLKQAIAESSRLLTRAHRREVPAERSQVCHALALVCEAARRTVTMRPYPVQVQAALGMLSGCAVQMNAGEGKTLSVALAAAMHGLAGRHCHVVTANDYLAGRDVELMRPLFDLCSLSAASLPPEADPAQRIACYGSDLVYATGKELLADFLRDRLGGADFGSGALRTLRRMTSSPQDIVMRGLDAAIVDEADSVLIDEATTPLIISSGEGNELLMEAVAKARSLCDELQPGRDYTVDHRFRDVDFTDAGKERIASLTEHLGGLWRSEARRDDLLSQAVVARDLFERDRHYIIQEGEVVIVDENTGRTMPGRSWSYGLHQAVEARAGVDMTEPARTVARMSFQDFYCRYRHLSGASGTLQGVGFELWRTYGLALLVVPPRLPSQLRVPGPRHFARSDSKFEALVAEVVQLQSAGKAVLVGTRRISDSERVAQALAARGLDCAVLNAKQHEHEAKVIAAAGEPGRVTVATNMAGRGTDILLSAVVLGNGGLHVLMLEPHESSRVDWQLFGRAGRQGAPGFARAFVSLEDDLLERHVAWFAKPVRWLSSLSVCRGALIPILVWLAQARAQALAWASRRALRSFEKRLNRQLSFVGPEGKPGSGPGTPG
jgi:preprotein translocase subunit SecA